MADNMTLRFTRDTQLNEKVSTTQYDIVHPETTALQVITDTLHRFVTDAQIESWTKGEGSAHYKGVWSSNNDYEAGDIVKDSNGYFYICVAAHLHTAYVTPNHTIAITYNNATTPVATWHNIDSVSYLAERASTLKTLAATQNVDYFLSFVNSNNNAQTGNPYEDFYTSANVKFNPSTGTLTATKFVGDLTGTASEAKHATNADHATSADTATSATTATTADTATNYTNTKDASGKTNIQTTIEGITKAIQDITSGSGGAILANKLFIQENGTTINTSGFDGSAAQTVNIDIQPSTVVGLLLSGKIDPKWLPDSVVGALRYKGTFNESGLITSSDNNFNSVYISNIGLTADNAGIYFMAAYTTANKGNAYAIGGVDDVRVGDWLVCNGAAGWAKIDNTDAVVSVNNQTGVVKTYKGTWATSTLYQSGDIVKYNNALYVCNTNGTSGTSFDETKFDIFGKVYTASKGIKLNGNNIEHDVAITAGTTTSADLKYGASFSVPSMTTDAYGHVTKVDINTWKMPDATADTWRSVKVNGTEVLTSAITTVPLAFRSGKKIDVTFNNNEVVVDHVESMAAAGEFTPSVVTTATATTDKTVVMGNGITVPTLTYDVYGHLTKVDSAVYRLPEVTDMIADAHFNIVKVNNIPTIKAYDSSATWIADAANADKFYHGTSIPTGTTTMTYNGDWAARNLYQVKNGVKVGVLDGAIKLFNGNNVAGNAIYGVYDNTTGVLSAGDSGVVAGTYSAVQVNAKGIVTAGGNIIEFGETVGADPSTSLAVGGLFFRRMS
jgi:hypothetical protein